MADGKYQGHKHHDQECYDENCGRPAVTCGACGQPAAAHIKGAGGPYGANALVCPTPVAKIVSTVTRPAYYGGADNPYEAIKVIEAWQLNFSLGNAVKYIARAGKKSSETALVDLDKAAQYIAFEIDRLKRAGAK